MAPVPLPAESLKVLAEHGLLRSLLRQILMAEVVAGDSLEDEARRQAVQQFAQQRGLDNAERLAQYCQIQGWTPEAMARQAELPLLLQRHYERVFMPKAEARFLERKQHLDQVVYSLLRLQHEGLARELFLQLQEGEASFSELSALYSEGPEKATRGVVGPVSLSQGHPQLVQRLQASTPGVVQEPFQIEQWWVVLRVESLRPATFDAAMALQMSKELFEQWLEQQIDQRIEQLRPLLMPASLQMPA